MASAGFEVFHCQLDRAALSEALNNQKFDMCLVDADDQHDVVRWLLEELYTKFPDTISLLLAHDDANEFILELLRGKNLNNLIAKHGGVAASSELIDENELIVTCQKLFLRDIFGIEKYLTTWGIKRFEHQITSADDKQRAIQDLEKFLTNIDCYGAIVNAVLLVADELLMNAIFNAPRTPDGKSKYVNVDRRERIKLDPSEYVNFCYACDGKNIALAVTDQFGSLNREVIVKYLQRCFSREMAGMEEKKAGAGLGLYMVFNSITQLTFNIQADVATEVVAMFYVRSGARAFKASGRSLNIFFLR